MDAPLPRRRRPRLARVALALVCLAPLTLIVAGELLAGPDRHGARETSFTVHSRLVGRDLRVVAAVPAGVGAGERRPLVVFLHGRSGKPGDFFSGEFYAALAKLGSRAPIVVQLDGGDHSYWHDRRGGRWGGYVLREAIPAAVRVLGADPARVAIGGISMGGYGAFDLARHARRGRFCAIGGHSPAFWLAAGDSAPGAFDDAADFARHDVYAYARSRRRPFGATPLWIDRGDRDPFAAADAQVVRALRADGSRVTSHVWSGKHETAYWRAHTARYLKFYANALARCGR
jgi:enterochelin esterase-like enzyme